LVIDEEEDFPTGKLVHIVNNTKYVHKSNKQLVKQSNFSKRAGASQSGMSLGQNRNDGQGFGKWDES
jgi:hypothetical protein